MKTNHTPGPWTLDVVPTGWMLISNGADVTAEAFDCSDADARLIAAAPDLLAALRALTAVVESYEYGRPWPGRPHAQMDAARAAINRATGA